MHRRSQLFKTRRHVSQPQVGLGWNLDLVRDFVSKVECLYFFLVFGERLIYLHTGIRHTEVKDLQTANVTDVRNREASSSLATADGQSFSDSSFTPQMTTPVLFSNFKEITRRILWHT